jgi:hypothetical protein
VGVPSGAVSQPAGKIKLTIPIFSVTVFTVAKKVHDEHFEILV